MCPSYCVRSFILKMNRQTRTFHFKVNLRVHKHALHLFCIQCPSFPLEKKRKEEIPSMFEGLNLNKENDFLLIITDVLITIPSTGTGTLQFLQQQLLHRDLYFR